MSAPSVTIIIPHFNSGRNLRACLQSIAEQQCLPDQVLIMDGASTDGSTRAASEFPALPMQVVSEPDDGIYDAMNKGLDRCTSEWVLFLGSDDRLAAPDVLDALKHVLDVSPAEVVSCAVRYVNRQHARVPEIHVPRTWNQLRWRNVAHHQGTLYRMSCFTNRRFDLRFPVLSDYHFNLRLHAAETKVELQSELLLSEVGAQGVSKRFDQAQYREEFRLKKDLWDARAFLHVPWLVVKWLRKRLG